MNIEVLVEGYVSIRDELAEARAAYKAVEEESKAAMADLEAQILQISNDTGVESFKTKSGTAFRTTKDYARVAPGARSQLDEWVLQTGNLQVYTSHLSKVAVKELMETGELEPSSAGIDYIQEDVIQVRRPTK